ncbi:MAG: 50S ribosomal protein L30 [Beijerinckiaceae bacterium]
MAKEATKTFIVEQYASQIRRPAKQGQTLTGLGLGKIGSRSTLKDTPEARGMLASVAHMVRIVDSQ